MVAVGLEKVIEMTHRLGITGVKKTCSMALGDGGISIIEHVGGIATFANGGKLARPYGILDITTSKGDLLYSRERDEGERPQVVDPKVAGQMNWMMQKVVEEGTGQAAKLDFTYSAGKTGTSTGPKDAWFVGFTGKYVAGVWLGNDDNRPMSGGSRGVTGGQFAAPIWHNFMAVAHTDMNIPPIPGIAIHPVQMAEQARIAELRAAEIAAGNISASTLDGKPTSAMSDQTRDTLKKLAVALRKASGISEPPGSTTGSIPSNAPDQKSAPVAPPAPQPSKQGALPSPSFASTTETARRGIH